MYSRQKNDYQTGFNSSISDVVIIYLVIKKGKFCMHRCSHRIRVSQRQGSSGNFFNFFFSFLGFTSRRTQNRYGRQEQRILVYIAQFFRLITCTGYALYFRYFFPLSTVLIPFWTPFIFFTQVQSTCCNICLIFYFLLSTPRTQQPGSSIDITKR